MKYNHSNDLRKINYLISEMESLYHQSSLKLGITDSVSLVLYTIYDRGDSCMLKDVYKGTGVSKQTINSAIRGLEADEVLYLEKDTGKNKRIVLTDKGKALVQNTAAKICEAEMRAFDSWSKQEMEEYIRLMEKYTECFRQQIEKM